MANFTVSPGVTTNELDQTFLTGQPVQAGAAIIGPTVKGPVEVPTLVTSYSQYTSLFGDSFISGGINYSYLTSIAAYNYFNYGGSSLLVARVASGTYTSATTSITSSTGSTTASLSLDLTSAATTAYTASFNGVNVILSGSTVQNVYNNATSSGIIPSNPTDLYTNTIINSSASFSTPNMILSASIAGITGNSYFVTSGSTTTFYTGGTNTTSLTLETISQGIIMNNSGAETLGALVSGSKDNVRVEITNLNTGSGTFNVLVRQGNDTTNNKNILESFNGVNLDPNSDRFISLVIGDQKLLYSSTNNQMELTGTYPNISRYIRVKSIVNTTPTYLDSNGTIANNLYPGYLPINQSSSFSTATGTIAANIGASMYDSINTTTQGLAASDYDKMVALFGNKEAYQFNLLFTPGLLNDKHTSVVSTIISNTQNRGDNLYVLDLIDYNGTVTSTITQAQTRNTSYAASYWPWVRIVDPATGRQVWVPASTVIPGVYAFNDKVSAPWFAPAGINRGGLSTVLQAQFKLTQANKDSLYSNNINPLATLPKNGVVVFGQKTLQKQASALDRVNVRRLMIEMKNYIRQIADTVVFEQNTIATRNSFVARVTPFLEGIQQKQGLYAYKIIMDESNNGPAVIDQNQLVGQIYIQPTRTAEFISLDFILLPTGAEFPG
jgi:uncharacterized protein